MERAPTVMLFVSCRVRRHRFRKLQSHILRLHKLVDFERLGQVARNLRVRWPMFRGLERLLDRSQKRRHCDFVHCFAAHHPVMLATGWPWADRW